ncbi:hypothetical protein RCL1_006944 [Eukaryota sp. TZLM3-RCL]
MDLLLRVSVFQLAKSRFSVNSCPSLSISRLFYHSANVSLSFRTSLINAVSHSFSTLGCPLQIPRDLLLLKLLHNQNRTDSYSIRIENKITPTIDNFRVSMLNISNENIRDLDYLTLGINVSQVTSVKMFLPSVTFTSLLKQTNSVFPALSKLNLIGNPHNTSRVVLPSILERLSSLTIESFSGNVSVSILVNLRFLKLTASTSLLVPKVVGLSCLQNLKVLGLSLIILSDGLHPDCSLSELIVQHLRNRCLKLLLSCEQCLHKCKINLGNCSLEVISPRLLSNVTHLDRCFLSEHVVGNRMVLELSKYPNLQEFTLDPETCMELGRKISFNFVLDNCPSLSSLSLPFFKTRKTFITLSSSLSSLLSFRCEHIDLDTLLLVLQQSEYLRSLTITQCLGNLDLPDSYEFPIKLNYLRCLEVSHGAGVFPYFPMLPRLTKLYVSFISDFLMNSINTKFPQLESLTVHDCLSLDPMNSCNLTLKRLSFFVADSSSCGGKLDLGLFSRVEHLLLVLHPRLTNIELKWPPNLASLIVCSPSKLVKNPLSVLADNVVVKFVDADQSCDWMLYLIM